MQIIIKTDVESQSVAISKDYRGEDTKGGIAHVLCEVRKIERELQEIWENLPS